MRTVIQTYTLSECMDAMTEYVASYEKLGVRNIVFCEDRLTLVAERALMRKLGGTFLSSVTTFARFLKTDKKVLSKQGSVMAVGDIMTRLQDEGKLLCFKSASSVGNNAKSIYETIAQFAASEISVEMLGDTIEKLPDDLLCRKLTDLKLIYEEYEARLAKEGYIDESKYLALLPDCLRADPTLRGANVYFLCYSSFTAQAASAVRAAIECADNVFGIFCDGEEELYTHQATDAFLRVCNEYGKTHIRKFGTPLGGEAETLRTGLYEPERLADGAVRAATTNVSVFEGEDMRGEAEFIAAKISRRMREDSSARYRDFAVLVPSVEAYSLPIKRVFDEYGIPCFFDEKKSIASHPIGEFVLAALETVRDGFSSVSVQALAQNYFFGESDEYRNYLLKYANYRGGALKEIRLPETGVKYDKTALEQGRERFLSIVSLIKRKSSGAEYCRAVRAVLKKVDAEQRLKELEESVLDASIRGYLAQIFAAIEKVLAEAEQVLGGRIMEVGDFEAVLSEGLAATELSLIPLKSDAVFVGGLVSSRIEKIDTLFAVGLTDGVPGESEDSALISDREIERLGEVKTRLDPTVAQVNLRSRENACLNLCTFTNQLYLTYPLSSDGETPAVSEIIRYAQGLFCEENGNPLSVKKGVSGDDLPYYCATKTPAVRRMILERAAFENRQKNNHVVYDSLFEALKAVGVELGETAYQKADFSDVAEAKELLIQNGRVSPTSVERYFACPFAAFVERGLKAKERDEAAVVAVDSGNFIHKLLEVVTPNLKSLETETEAVQLAQETAQKLLTDPSFAAQGETARGAYASARLVKEGEQVVRAVFHQLKNSDFTVEGLEVPVSTPDYYGKVDRVDGNERFVRVIDYKTGSISAKPEEYYVGKKLQLPLYMSALAEGRTPAGIFYFPASFDYSKSADGRFKMVGYSNADPDAVLSGDKTLAEGQSSAFFDGNLSDKPAKSAMPSKDFSEFIEYASMLVSQAKSDISDGYVAANPYQGACNYCKLGGACGFNACKEPFRAESAMTTQQIVNIVRKEKGED